MLAALGVMSRTAAISAGVSCSQAHSRSSSASSSRSASSASARSGARSSSPGPGTVAARRVHGRDPGREPPLTAYAAGGVGEAVAGHAVGPRQRLGRQLVEPAPADQQRLREHVVGRGGVGAPGEEAAQRLDERRLRRPRTAPSARPRPRSSRCHMSGRRPVLSSVDGARSTPPATSGCRRSLARRPDAYLTAVDSIVDLLARSEVAAAWDPPSALAEWSVSGLAGHLAGQVFAA